MKAFIRALAVVAFAALGIGLADAQTTTNFNNNANKVPPRAGIDPQVHFIRTNLTFQMCTQVSATCTVKVTNAALPYNAIVLRVTFVTFTAFNSTTSDVMTVGTTQANANEIVSTGVSVHAAGSAAGTITSTAQGATGAGATQTGDDGGFNLWVKWTAGANNTASAGVADMIVEYLPGTDGVCTSVPLGSTAAAC